ncbi:MAG: UDP-N-acetylmuramate dehydrogenase [Pseudomonadota bacterium]|nr:UDP-N-acetylmuramate dehydrogenase [Pseudomonadota bacterium]MDE3038838.1 UDP-N-acetylmuramate dehydrogenase [Pseudomonadota bacterium]
MSMAAMRLPPNPESWILNPRLRKDADLSRTNWFRVGGKAEYLFKPESAEDLSAFLKLLPAEIPVTVLGVGSNVIIRDGGIDGVVVRLGRGFTSIFTSPLRGEVAERSDAGGGEPANNPAPSLILPPQGGGSYIIAGAGALDIHVAAIARDNGLSGLEFLSGIPGTIGGAVRMNAGAYGSDISQILVKAEIVERNGKTHMLNNKELCFTYRHSSFPEGAIVTKAVFKAQPGNKEAITRKMQDIAASREATQPIRTRTGGSTFKNPPGHKAWELIEQSGCRGLVTGGAQVSEKHCNFFINTGSATAADLENLGGEVIRRVKEKTSVTLEWEIKRIGNV